MEYGLIGAKLAHSYSTYIHNKLNCNDYSLKELNEEELPSFLSNKEFKGLNVTIPYKQNVIPYLDKLDRISRKTNVVNTIINKDNKLYGYNTDYYGFDELLNYYNLNDLLVGSNILILGSGATSRTIKTLLKTKRVNKIYVVSREGKLNYNNLDKLYNNIDVIINATPFNMYPNNKDESLIDLEKFDKVKLVIDAIYNPYKTKLLLDAKRLDIPSYNGLYMLVAQAFYSEQLFKGIKLDKSLIASIYNDILYIYSNIVLVGMPSVGKSSIANKLSSILNKKVIDTDKLIEEKENKSCKDIINELGEEKFRNIESEIINSLKNKQGYIISTGGGVILNPANVDILNENGIIIFINKSLECLKALDDRPLTDNDEKLKEVYEYRLPIYKKIADIVINSNNDEEIVDIIVKEMKV